VHFGAPYYQVHRADLLGILVNALGDTGIHLNAHVQALEQDGHSVTMTLANGRTVTGDVLVGADGIHSTVRAQLFGREQPRYTGCVAWRGLVPAERLTHLDLGRVNGIWIGPNRSMVQYYVSAGRMFNWVGISRSAHAAQESWLAEGRAEDALAEYADWHPAIRAIIGATPRVLRQALYDREPLAEWGVGRVVLLGDAAHPMMPFYAQGAGQSIEDAYILAGCVALWPDEPVAALQQYARLRQPRTAWIQQLSRREEELYHLANPAEIARRNTTLRQNQSLSAAAFPPEQERLYSYNAEAVLRS
jgi:2-polyprenyl-6-methoxyphenol hydroxylase-like FAD-dependent oxidoreductase